MPPPNGELFVSHVQSVNAMLAFWQNAPPPAVAAMLSVNVQAVIVGLPSRAYNPAPKSLGEAPFARPPLISKPSSTADVSVSLPLTTRYELSASSPE